MWDRISSFKQLREKEEKSLDHLCVGIRLMQRMGSQARPYEEPVQRAIGSALYEYVQHEARHEILMQDWYKWGLSQSPSSWDRIFQTLANGNDLNDRYLQQYDKISHCIEVLSKLETWRANNFLKRLESVIGSALYERITQLLFEASSSSSSSSSA